MPDLPVNLAVIVSGFLVGGVLVLRLAFTVLRFLGLR